VVEAGGRESRNRGSGRTQVVRVVGIAGLSANLWRVPGGESLVLSGLACGCAHVVDARRDPGVQRLVEVGGTLLQDAAARRLET